MCTNVSTLPCNHGSCNHAELPARADSAKCLSGRTASVTLDPSRRLWRKRHDRTQRSRPLRSTAASLGRIAAGEDSRMAEEIVRGQTGRKIGTLETRPDGILVAKDLSGKKVGEYDPDNDVTRDGRG